MSDLNDLLKIMEDHAKYDRLRQGSWIKGKDKHGIYRGCFFGCAMQTVIAPIEKACEKYGLALWIGYWSEAVFEGLPQNEAIEWPVKLLKALIKFDGCTERLRHDLAIKRLTRLSAKNTGDIKHDIDQVIEYHKNPSEHF